jgi:hypothetical protein
MHCSLDFELVDYYFKGIKQEVFLSLPLEAGLILIFAAVAQLTILAPTRRPAFSNLSIPGAIILWIAIALFLGGLVWNIFRI